MERTPESEPAQGTSIGTGVAPVPKRNHNRNAMSGKPKEPMTVEQKQQAITMAAAGHSCNKISQAIGKDRVAIKRHLDTPEAIEQVRDERTELVELYREKARDCVAAIDDDKIAKASALQLATSRGILLDKSLLLSGKPTQNVAVIVEELHSMYSRPLFASIWAVATNRSLRLSMPASSSAMCLSARLILRRAPLQMGIYLA